MSVDMSAKDSISPRDSRDLEGKSALVTGGGKGIGAAIAARLARAGARVVVAGRTLEPLREVALAVGGVALSVDLTSRAATDQFVAKVKDAVGRVDILVNNAGIAKSAPVAETTDQDWDAIFELNATAPFRLTRAFLPSMVEAGWGRVIHVASNAGLTGYRYTGAYCASKHAVVGFTRALALDVGASGVTVNAVCPGWVDTEMARNAVARIAEATGRSEEKAERALKGMSPQNRFIQVDEVAHAVWSLAVEGSRGINGQTIVVDGGQVLK